MNERKKWMGVLALGGFADALYLTYQHYSDTIPPCSTNPLVDCGKVLGSAYATIGDVPLALLGAVHYLVLAVLVFVAVHMASKKLFILASLQSFVGALVSTFLVYLQLGPLGAICLYCMLSAVISIAIAGIAVSIYYSHEHSQQTRVAL